MRALALHPTRTLSTFTSLPPVWHTIFYTRTCMRRRGTQRLTLCDCVGSGQDYKAPDYWVHEIQLVIKIYEEHSQVHQRRASSRPPSVAQRPMLRPRPPPTVRLPACAPRR